MKRKFYRNKLKKLYKNKKYEDKFVGEEKNMIVQGILKCKSDSERELFYEELKELFEKNRFRQDFPTFRSFYQFVKTENLKLEDLV